MASKKAEHVALYRTYRPKSFGDVEGQEHVVSVLSQAVKSGKISHAYLFSGGRGTGKTSVARILAHEIGCTDKDLYEIDAASNRGIDDIRELRDGVHVLPFESPYKVYIIDEVHMLTKEAFNALLKTLEEPPSHVVFVLATTERHRVPDTIQSRCEAYTFKQPSRQLLADTLSHVAKKEGFTLEQSAADLIALLGEGSFRDALGILQKVLVISKNKKVEVKEVEAVTGAPAGEMLRALLAALADGNTEDALSVVEKVVENNMDIRMLTKLLMHRVRVALLLRHAPDLGKTFEKDFTEEDFKQVEEVAKRKDSALNATTLHALLQAYTDMAYAVVPALPLELALMSLKKEDISSEEGK